MNKFKQLATMLFMTCGIVMSMTSCGKETPRKAPLTLSARGN